MSEETTTRKKDERVADWKRSEACLVKINEILVREHLKAKKEKENEIQKNGVH